MDNNQNQQINTQNPQMQQPQGPMKICKHCSSTIPKKAKVCPVCRKKQGGKIKWIIIAIVVIGIIGATASGGNKNKPKKVADSNSTETQQNNTKDESKETIFRKGETAEMNNIQVTLTDYKESAGGEWNKPADGNIFLIAEFEIANNSEKELAVSSIMSFDAYADGYSLNYSLSALMEKEGSQLDGTVAAGKKLRGWIGWEVPQDYHNVEIHFTDNVWSDDKFEFLIEK